jgi:hypothetical protein
MKHTDPQEIDTGIQDLLKSNDENLEQAIDKIF